MKITIYGCSTRSQEEILAAMTPNLQRSIDGDLSPE
jgi:hypothetical protein